MRSPIIWVQGVLCLFVVVASGRVCAQSSDLPNFAADKLTGD